MFKLSFIKVIIRQAGTNQAVVVKGEGGNTSVTQIDEYGKTVIPLKKENLFWFSLKEKLRTRNFRLTLTTVFVLTIGGASLLHLLTRDTLENRLYDRYYRPMTENATRLIIENSAFDEAKRKYEEGEHNVAWLLMVNLPDNFSFKTEKIFYQALTLMEMGKFDQAINKFNVLLDMPNNKDILVIAKWYQGLCYLKTADFEKAKQLFTFINSSNCKYSNKAYKILKEIS